MARTQQQIEQEILQAKAQYPELSDLNSPSQTAIWRLWVSLTAFAHHILEKLFDVFTNEITTLVASRRLGTPPWYVQLALDFQLGDILLENGTYAVIDSTKKIITRSAFRESGGFLTLKVAKGNAPAQALNPTELLELKSYINKIKFAGTTISVVSLNADVLVLTLNIYYNAILDPLQTKNKVISAIQGYLASIKFDAKFLKNEMIEQIRNIEGVFDCEITAISGNGTPIGREYDISAGYMTYVPNLANITLIAN